MILKPVKENGSWSELRNIESDISFRANDYVRITSSIDKEKIILITYSHRGEIRKE